MSPLKKLGFLWSYSLLAVLVGGFYLHDALGVFSTWVALPFIYLVIPIMDALFGKDPENVRREAYETVLNDRYFDVLVYSFVYLQIGLLLWAGWQLLYAPLTGWQQAGLMLSVGMFSGTIINVAHELGHRSSAFARFHAKMALMTVSYMHFYIEHNRGHHVHVATPQDPATAQRNQSLYAFWWQSVTGSFRSAWTIQKRLLRKENRAVWSLRNPMVQAVLLPVLFCIMLTIILWMPSLGAMASIKSVAILPVFFIVQSLVGILLLESVNYIEHYGILRRETVPGRYERVNPLHSWNASHLISNLVLFQLQRHSDHHAYAARPYQVLRHFDESPQLPFGYPLMILIALVPPLWFRLMNPRLDRWKSRACSPEEISRVVRQFA